jgi:hypothetical protein
VDSSSDDDSPRPENYAAVTAKRNMLAVDAAILRKFPVGARVRADYDDSGSYIGKYIFYLFILFYICYSLFCVLLYRHCIECK